MATDSGDAGQSITAGDQLRLDLHPDVADETIGAAGQQRDEVLLQVVELDAELATANVRHFPMFADLAPPY